MSEVERTFVIQRGDKKVLELVVMVDRGFVWYIMKRDNRCDRSISEKNSMPSWTMQEALVSMCTSMRRKYSEVNDPA